jgi:hypothetical protein
MAKGISALNRAPKRLQKSYWGSKNVAPSDVTRPWLDEKLFVFRWACLFDTCANSSGALGDWFGLRGLALCPIKRNQLIQTLGHRDVVWAENLSRIFSARSSVRRRRTRSRTHSVACSAFAANDTCRFGRSTRRIKARPYGNFFGCGKSRANLGVASCSKQPIC